jgi:hypothetical protein
MNHSLYGHNINGVHQVSVFPFHRFCRSSEGAKTSRFLRVDFNCDASPTSLTFIFSTTRPGTHSTMAQTMTSIFEASSSTTRILLNFWPTKRVTSPLDLQILSDTVLNRNPLQTSSALKVWFGTQPRGVVITEEVKGLAKAGNGVRGVLNLPFADLEEPSFEYGAQTGKRISIVLTLRQGTDLAQKYYSAEVQGTWKDGTKRMLQTKQLQELTHKTRTIIITLQVPPKAPGLIRSHILSIFNPPAVAGGPGAGIAKTPGKKSAKDSAEEDIKAKMTRQKVEMEAKVELARKRKQEEEVRVELEKQEQIKLKQPATTRGPAGPFVIEASNFTSGTTVIDIELALREVVAITEPPIEVVSCRLMSERPTIIAEIVVTEQYMADAIIDTFNGQKVDGRILHVSFKRSGPGSAPLLREDYRAVGSLQERLRASEQQIQEMRHVFTELLSKYRASLDHIKVLQNTVKSAERRNSTEAPLVEAPHLPGKGTQLQILYLARFILLVPSQSRRLEACCPLMIRHLSRPSLAY